MSIVRRVLGAVLIAALAPSTFAANDDIAKKHYRLYCMGCHRADGKGSPEIGIPGMRDQVGHFLRLPEGRASLSQVPGTLNTPLGNGETAELLNWIMANIGGTSVPADFVPYTAEDVARYRATVPTDIPATRVRLLSELKAMGIN